MRIKNNVAISESGYVFNPSTGESFSINPVGVELFNMIKEERSYEEISKVILSRYNTDKDTFEKDYNDFIGLLKQYMLLDNNHAE